MKTLKALQNAGFVIKLCLKMMLNYEIIVMLLENIRVLHTEMPTVV